MKGYRWKDLFFQQNVIVNHRYKLRKSPDATLTLSNLVLLQFIYGDNIFFPGEKMNNHPRDQISKSTEGKENVISSRDVIHRLVGI